MSFIFASIKGRQASYASFTGPIVAGLRVNLAETLSLASGGNGLPQYEAVPDAALIFGANRNEM
ncbi:MAG: hypothetical protein ABI770_05660, partial [Sphingomicrobium sp.]